MCRLRKLVISKFDGVFVGGNRCKDYARLTLDLPKLYTCPPPQKNSQNFKMTGLPKIYTYSHLQKTCQNVEMTIFFTTGVQNPHFPG